MIQDNHIDISSSNQHIKNKTTKKKLIKKASNKQNPASNRVKISKITHHTVENSVLHYDVDLERDNKAIGVKKISSNQIKKEGKEYITKIIDYAQEFIISNCNEDN